MMETGSHAPMRSFGVWADIVCVPRVMNMHATIPAAPGLAAVKSRQQMAWGSGDYAIVGTTLQIVGEMLCEAVDVRSGHTHPARRSSDRRISGHARGR